MIKLLTETAGKVLFTYYDEDKPQTYFLCIIEEDMIEYVEKYFIEDIVEEMNILSLIHCSEFGDRTLNDVVEEFDYGTVYREYYINTVKSCYSHLGEGL